MHIRSGKKLNRASLRKKFKKQPNLLKYVLNKTAINEAFKSYKPFYTTSAHTSTARNEQNDNIIGSLIPSARVSQRKTTTKKVQAKKVKLEEKMSDISSTISSIISDLPVLDDNSYTSDEEDDVISRTTKNVVPQSACRPTLQPSTSAGRPSYIAMVKTAIRDLIPYKMTHREGISKYIEIRYGVSDCKVLRHALKWMLDMKVLKRKGCLYFFTSGTVDKSCMTPMSQEKTQSKRSYASQRQSSRGDCAPNRSSFTRRSRRSGDCAPKRPSSTRRSGDCAPKRPSSTRRSGDCAPKRQSARRSGKYKCHYLNEGSDDAAVPYKNVCPTTRRSKRKSCTPKKRKQRCPPRKRKQRYPQRRRRTGSCGPKRRSRQRTPSRRSRCGPARRRRPVRSRRSSCKPKKRRCTPKRRSTSKKCSSKRHPMCTRKRCICYSALHKKADKVKVGSRCIQKGGKYYMQSIYV